MLFMINSAAGWSGLMLNAPAHLVGLSTAHWCKSTDTVSIYTQSEINDLHWPVYEELGSTTLTASQPNQRYIKAC